MIASVLIYDLARRVSHPVTGHYQDRVSCIRLATWTDLLNSSPANPRPFPFLYYS